LTDALKNGGWRNGKEKDLDLLAENFKQVQQHSANMKAIVMDATVYHYAGANLVQTIAYALAHAIEYLDAMKTRGIEPLSAIDRMVFRWPCGTSFFAEIAALRALRLLWNNLCGHITGNAKTLYKACVHAETSLHSWSVADMYNNLLRATTQSMSAIAGGAHTVYTHPYNVVGTYASEFSERMSANIQLLLREESFFGKTADPAAGSQLVEELTHQLAENALALLKKTEAAGGLLSQVRSGELQRSLALNLEKMKEAVKNGEIKVLGANLYPNKNEDISQVPRRDLFGYEAAGKEFPVLKMQRLSAILEHN
jgi:methylmalonyl-CoA mutase